MRSAFHPHERVTKAFKLPSRTQQSFKDETDINNIMRKYQKTGLIDHVNEHGATYGDQPYADDYHSAMNLVADTNSMFEELPSSVRADFDNDPSKFLDYVADEERRETLLKEKKINSDEPETEPSEDPETGQKEPKEGD